MPSKLTVHSLSLALFWVWQVQYVCNLAEELFYLLNFQDLRAILGGDKKYFKWQKLSVTAWKGEHCIPLCIGPPENQ